MKRQKFKLYAVLRVSKALQWVELESLLGQFWPSGLMFDPLLLVSFLLSPIHRAPGASFITETGLIHCLFLSSCCLSIFICGLPLKIEFYSLTATN